MKRTICILLAIWFVVSGRVLAQDFPIGIWFGGNDDAIDSVAAMNFTWIHGYGGWNQMDTPNFSHIVQNDQNLNVIAVLERNINYPSFAQRMEYQAELTDSEDGTRNYFAAHPTGTDDITLPDVWIARVASHTAGYMVQSPDPDNQYFYERMNWVATANISIDPTGNATDQVVRMEIADGGISRRKPTTPRYSNLTLGMNFC